MSTGAILVSGGSRGLGLAIVRHLLDAGRPVGTFARARSAEVAELQRHHSDKFGFAELDARDIDGIGAFVTAIQSRYGSLHGLVNNAAIGQDSLLVHTPPEAIAEIVAVNLVAPILLTRLVVRHMLLQPEGGRIVNISSLCGLRGFSGLTVYSATKAALGGFTRALAREVGSRNVLVNSIAPGFFESEMSSALNTEDLGTIRRHTPTGRLTTASDIFPVLDMLVFGDTNMTGQTIVVDGGSGC
jgi:3-oxoacyl-[acyl-carrier protein] reductase